MLTWVEIDKKALENNWQELRRAAGKGILIIPIIKSNAYGHGFDLLSSFYDTKSEIKKIGVVNLEEALRLRELGIKKSALVLSFFDIEKAGELTAGQLKKISLPIYDLETALRLNQLAQKKGIKIKIHLKIDTGTSRIGFLPREITNQKNIKMLKSFKNLKIEGVYSHFAASEKKTPYTQKQIKTFEDVIAALRQAGIDPPFKHFACTAAALSESRSKFNALRLGIGLYGLWPSDYIREKSRLKLKPVLSWYTRLIQVKKIPVGAPVGYDCSYITRRSTLLGVIPVGYWDGFDRRLSNCGQVLHKGKRCKILGRVCMNMTMIDLTGHKAKIGDKITLLGREEREEINVDEMARKIDTINYEIISRINPAIPRLFKKYVDKVPRL